MQEAVILLVEGRGVGAASFVSPLKKAGYEVHLVHTGTAALSWSDGHEPDLVVFDASSMRSSGVRSCQRLRRVLGETPIIHCRVAGEAKDEAIGADRYLQRPFTARKLINRIRALLPADDMSEEIVRCGNITLYRSKRSVEVDGQGERRLTPKLVSLLEQFLRYPEEVISRKELMSRVWKTDYIGDTRTLDVHIRWVRESIEADPAHPQLVKTVRGKGYKFCMPPPLPDRNQNRPEA